MSNIRNIKLGHALRIKLFEMFPLFQDINECENNLCEHGAKCVDQVNAYVCQCAAGYTGTHCETGE